MGFILMYDITNEDSFNAVQDWATQIKTYSWDSAQGNYHVAGIIYSNSAKKCLISQTQCVSVLLVGNKADMASERVVTTERGQELANQLGKLCSQNNPKLGPY